MPPLTTISTDSAELDREWVIDAVLSSYWGKWMTVPQLVMAINTSLCFSLHIRGVTPLQIGFARVVTDRATFSSVMDVVVRDGWRGRGFGTKLMQAVVAHPQVAPTICVLNTRDADGFYAKFGFSRTLKVMQRGPT